MVEILRVEPPTSIRRLHLPLTDSDILTLSRLPEIRPEVRDKKVRIFAETRDKSQAPRSALGVRRLERSSAANDLFARVSDLAASPSSSGIPPLSMMTAAKASARLSRKMYAAAR